MLRFHSDRKQVLECKVKVEGADLRDATARLVLQDEDVNRVFEGKIDVLGNCKIQLPPMDDFKNSTGKASMEVKVKDVIFEPLREEYVISKRQVRVEQVNIVDKSKQQLFTEKTSIPDKKMIKNLIEKFNKLPKQHKKALKEHVEFDYEPSAKVRAWARKRFHDLDTIQAKMVMYQVENILQ